MLSQQTIFNAKSATSSVSPHDSRYNKDQDLWRELIEKSKLELLDLLNDPEAIQELASSDQSEFDASFEFFCEKRAEIALTLGHGKDHPSGDRSGRYGKLRNENTFAAETVKATAEKTWPHQQAEIFAQIQSIIQTKDAALAVVDEYGTRYTFDDYYIDVTKEKASYLNKQEGPHEHPATIYTITYRSPIKTQQVGNGQNHNQSTMVVKLRDFDDNKDENWLSFDYADINKYDKRGDLWLANSYYQACQRAADTQEFMLNAGRLSHLLAQLLWVQRGNASIVECVVDVAARRKGIELGPFNQAEKLSWDWKAFVTPSREAYAKWYVEHAYTHVKDSKPALKPF